MIKAVRWILLIWTIIGIPSVLNTLDFGEAFFSLFFTILFSGLILWVFLI